MNLQWLVLDWANFTARWLHVITAIAWIGSSFYFVHLDLSLKKHEALPDKAGGDTWQVHGGGFYHMTKYMVAPATMPKELTWFKWEAYWTFLSGFLLLGLLYYTNANLYLIDKTVLPLEPWQAIAISLGILVGGWIIYDGLCRSPLGRSDLALGLAYAAFLVATAWGLTKVFGGRGAFLQLGAMIGTSMVASVAMIIIPNQRKVVASLLAGQTPDPALGTAAKQRSLHNNYLTLPVLFLMLSNHYPLAFASRWNWVIASLVLVLGVVLRHFFNSRHAHKPTPWWTWGVAALCLCLMAWLSSLGPAGSYAQASATPAPGRIEFAQVEEIMATRCSMCHAKEPLWEGMIAPPKGVMLDTPEAIKAHTVQIAMQAVYSHAMPPGGNLTDISDEERALLAGWINQPN